MELLSWTLILIVVSTIVSLVGWYSKRKHSYWSAQNLSGPKPWPLLGNVWTLMTNTPDQIELDWSRKYGKLYGHYVMFEPIVTIADPELIKQVMVKDFDKFVNRRITNMHDEIWSNNVSELEDDRWKAVRSIISPTFSSGKLRGMQPLINRTINQLIQYLDLICLDSEKSSSLNIREIVGGFAIDTIALTSFSTKTNTNGDPARSNNKNPFLEHAKQFFNFNIPKIILILFAPTCLLRLLNITMFFNQKSFGYFVKICRQILNDRTESKLNHNRTGQKRNDLIQLLLDASVDENELTTTTTNYDKLVASADNDQEQDNVGPTQAASLSTTKRKLTENEVIAQCIVFMVAGFETTAATLSHLLYELALNQDIQDRLCDELQNVLEDIDDTDSKEYYDTVINGIPLLEAVIKETLRKYPPISRLERRLGVDKYKLAGVELYKNQMVEIAAYAVHHSEEYYPDPERFNPERFMPENKHLLVPYTYLPFGAGPRNCVGLRFADQQMKLLLSQLLTRYRFEPTPETPIPLQFTKGSGLISVSTISLKISKR